MDKPLVSIIIPTLNSEKFLEDTLRSVKQQTYQNIEMIVIDGGSTDLTVDIASRNNAKVVSSKPGRSLQKNEGAKTAKGEIIYFVDDDFILDKKIVEEGVALIQGGLDMIAIHNTSDPNISFWSKVRKFERDMLFKDTHNISPRFLKKDIFTKVSGFNENMAAGEDYDLYNRLLNAGFKLGFGSYHEVHLGEPKTLLEIVKKHFFYGESVNGLNRIEVGQKPVLTFWQKSPIKHAYIVNWHLFFLHPILSFGLVIYNFTRYLSGFLGLLIGKVRGNNKKDRVFR